MPAITPLEHPPHQQYITEQTVRHLQHGQTDATTTAGASIVVTDLECSETVEMVHRCVESRPSTKPQLPLEVALIIFEKMDSVKDKFRLATTCRGYWECLAQYLFKRLAAGMNELVSVRTSFSPLWTTRCGFLHLAAYNGWTAFAENLLENRAEVNYRRTEKECTPLYAACASPNQFTDMVQLLLKHGADATLATSDGFNALHMAAMSGYDVIVGVLLDKGIDIDTEVGKAASVNLWRTETADALLIATTCRKACVVDVLLARNPHQGRIRQAFHYSLSAMSSAGSAQHLEEYLLISTKLVGRIWGRLLPRTPQEDNGLWMEYGKGTDAVLYFLTRTERLVREDLIGTDVYGQTFLHLIADVKLAGYLWEAIQESVDVNARDGAYGRSPLHYAALNNNVPMIRFLHQRGANLQYRDNDNLTPLALLCRDGSGDTTDTVRTLLELGAHPEPADNSDNPPIITVRCTRSTELLILYGADPNCRDSNNNTALHEDNPKIVNDLEFLLKIDVLLRYGVDINSRGYNWNTPLHTHAKEGNLTVVRHLLERGANPNVLNASNLSPLNFAVRIQHCPELVWVLLENRANPEFYGYKGSSPLQDATSGGWCKVVAMLLYWQACPLPVLESKAYLPGTLLEQIVRLLKKWDRFYREYHLYLADDGISVSKDQPNRVNLLDTSALLNVNSFDSAASDPSYNWNMYNQLNALRTEARDISSRSSAMSNHFDPTSGYCKCNCGIPH